MRFLKTTALGALALGAAACSGSGNEDTASAEAAANLEAENLDSTITSDEASSLNEAESRELNVATE
jgi:ABC-type glycerol-3-phosphate transport system substrate-binding protein